MLEMQNNTKIIGIGGGSGSGKTTIIKRIAGIIDDFIFIPQDNYYKSAHNINNSNIKSVNFDHPDAVDEQLLFDHLTALKRGRAIAMPQYDFVHHLRTEETLPIAPKPIILVDGILIFNNKDIRDLMDLKIFVDTPADIRFIRRLQRDINERGRTVESVIEQYMTTVRPGYFEFIEPFKRVADLIIPEGGFNDRALDVITGFITNSLNGNSQ